MMTDITVTVPEAQLTQLQEKADRLSIDDILSRPDEEFRRTADYVLQKNAELYRRLA